MFWREFYPRADAATPPKWQQMIYELAEARFGTQYRRQSGIVRFANPQRLREHLGVIPEGRQADADICFFTKKNPGYCNGDELVCVTDLDLYESHCRRQAYGLWSIAMSIGEAIANLAWGASCLPSWRRFRNSIDRPELTQQTILRNLVQNARDTAFGHQHGFDQIRDYHDLHPGFLLATTLNLSRGLIVFEEASRRFYRTTR